MARKPLVLKKYISVVGNTMNLSRKQKKEDQHNFL
jgi:hypothetical protein